MPPLKFLEFIEICWIFFENFTWIFYEFPGLEKILFFDNVIWPQPCTFFSCFPGRVGKWILGWICPDVVTRFAVLEKTCCLAAWVAGFDLTGGVEGCWEVHAMNITTLFTVLLSPLSFKMNNKRIPKLRRRKEPSQIWMLLGGLENGGM